MNDEFLRRQAEDVGSDELPDYGFGGGPLFRDEVAADAGESVFGAVTSPGATGFHDASLFRDGGGLDYGSGGDYGTGLAAAGFGGFGGSGGWPVPRFLDGRQVAGLVPPTRPPSAPAAPAAPSGADGQPQWAPNEGPLRVVPADQASALLRIKLPDAPPVPATTLRSDAPIEEVVEAVQMLHHVSPARPNALPGDVLALTMATMVVPMQRAASGARPARLTASVPPDLASRAEADLLSDTVEQFFGDFDAIGRELEAQRAGGAAAAGAAVGAVPAGYGEPAAEASQTLAVPGQYAPAAPNAGRYGVPTQFPGYDAARRSPVGMRYLGGIFHDSSGESSFYDPATESLVPMGAAAFSAADFRRTSAPSALRPLPPPRTGAVSSATTGTVPRPTRPPRDDDTAVMPGEHWTDHHPDHRTVRGPGRRHGRVALVSAVATVLAFGGTYGAALAWEGQVPKGTVVDGVSIGGLSRSAAATKLAAALAPRLSAPLRLTAGSTGFQLSPEESGLHIDYASTVADAASDRDDPAVAVPALFGQGRDVPLRVRIDRDALRAAVAKATAGFDKPMVDGGVTFPAGVPTPIAPHPGRQVDVDAAVNAVAAAFDDGVESVHLAALGRGGESGSAAASARQAGTDTALAIAPVAYVIPDKNAPASSQHAAALKQSPVMPSPTPTPTPTPTPIPVPPPPPAPAAPPPSATTFPAPPITLIVHIVQPTVTPAAVAQAMQDFARPAMSGPITLVTGSIRTTLKPTVLGRYLTIAPDGHGALVPKLDGAGVRGEIAHDALAKLERPPTEAAFTVVAGKPVLVPGKNGTGFAPEAIQKSVLPVLTKTAAAQRVAAVPLGPLPPALTTEAAQALGIRDVMGTYTAPFPAGAPRTANIKRAADLLHGQILQPGQVFSLNQVLGARSAPNGFVPAGGSTSADTSQDAGAGTSLVATALFNAEYLAGLKDVEHHPHATVTDHFPPGMEAAVAYPGVDLKFQNDSGAPVYLWTASTDNAVTVAVLGQKAYDTVQTEMSPHYALVPPKSTTASGAACVPGDGVPGFQIDVTRILTKADQTGQAAPLRQVFHTTYAAQDKVVCGAGATGPTGSAAAGGPPTNSPSGGATASQHPTTGGPSSSASGSTGGTGATTAPTSGGTPTGGATSGSPTTTPSAGWDGSLLGGLLGAPSSRR